MKDSEHNSSKNTHNSSSQTHHSSHHHHHKADSSELFKRHSLQSAKNRKLLRKAFLTLVIALAILIAGACFIVTYFDIR